MERQLRTGKDLLLLCCVDTGRSSSVTSVRRSNYGEPHSNQNPRWPQKPIYSPIFTHHITSWLIICPPVIVVALGTHSPQPTAHTAVVHPQQFIASSKVQGMPPWFWLGGCCYFVGGGLAFQLLIVYYCTAPRPLFVDVSYLLYYCRTRNAPEELDCCCW